MLRVDDHANLFATLYLFPWNVIPISNPNPTSPDKLPVSQGEGPCFNNVSHVLGTFHMHLQLAEDLERAKHYVRREDGKTQLLAQGPSLGSALIYAITVLL